MFRRRPIFACKLVVSFRDHCIRAAGPEAMTTSAQRRPGVVIRHGTVIRTTGQAALMGDTMRVVRRHGGMMEEGNLSHQ